jgi:hypothetical protein
MRQILVGCVFIFSGCKDERAMPPEEPPSGFVAGLWLTRKDHQPIGSALTLSSSEQEFFRIEFKPSENPPEQLQGRDVAEPQQWELALLVFSESTPTYGGTPPEWRSAVPYYDDAGPGGGHAAVSGPNGTVEVEFPKPPTSPDSSHVYRCATIFAPRKSGEHAAVLQLFPTADPPPVPGKLSATREYGPPVTLWSGAIRVVE